MAAFVLLPGDPLPNGRTEPSAVRWCPSRKAEVLRRLRAGELTLNDALERFRLTLEEGDAWQMAERRAGRAGLKATAIRASSDRKPVQGGLF
jgi:hypothetical protein